MCDYDYQHYLAYHTPSYSQAPNGSIVQEIEYNPGTHTLKVNLLVLFKSNVPSRTVEQIS
jgi:hypothetical protein